MTPTLNSIISRLHVKQLRLLIAIEEHGSLLGAARQLAMTQPGASKALHEIETTFGASLFERSNRGLEPNAVGHCVIRYARLIQSDLAHLREEMVGIMRGHGGRVSVGVIMGAVPLLTDAVTVVTEAQPDMSIEIVEDTSATLLSLIDAGRLDLAICRTSVSQTPYLYDSAFVRDETLAVIANTGHPLAHEARVSLGDLTDYRWVVYRANMPMRLLLEREFHDAGLRFPAHLLETTSAFATVSLLQKNPSLVALVSTDVARFYTGHGVACTLPLQLASRSEPYELVTRRGAPLSHGARMLMDAIVAHGAERGE
jgi:DNA-binding transcriptional LysR family regulator